MCILFKYEFDIVLHTITMEVQYVLCNSIKSHSISYNSKDPTIMQKKIMSSQRFIISFSCFVTESTCNCYLGLSSSIPSEFYCITP